METIIQDVRYAARSLARTPVLAIAAVLTLGLGIGANSAMFGVVDRLFFRPPALVKDPTRIRELDFTKNGDFDGPIANYPRLADFQARTHAFSQVAAFVRSQFSLGVGPGAQRVDAQLVSKEFFALTGVQPVIGRFFTDDEDTPNHAAHVAVLSNEFWHKQFGAAPGVLGTELRVGRSVYTVIGVAPAGFAGVDLHVPDLWLPMATTAPESYSANILSCDGCFWFGGVVGRLTPTFTVPQARAEATSLYRSFVPATGKPAPSDSTARAVLSTLNQALVGNGTTGSLSIWIGAVCGIVLLIACANVANLLLARAVRRRREIALRVALGSSRGRLVRQLYVESGLLAVLGGGAGVLVALWAGPILRSSVIPRSNATDALDVRVLVFTAFAVLLTTFLAGIAPVFHTGTRDIAGALKAGGREGTFRRSFTQTGLLVGQVALTLVLLTGAGLFIATVRQVRGLRMGFDADRLIVSSVDLNGMGLKKPAIVDMYQRIEQQVSHVPGVQSAALSIGTPFQSLFGVGLRIPGLDSLPNPGDVGSPFIEAVTPDYFRTMGTAIRQGRGFTDADTRGAPHVVVVSEGIARAVWPGESPLGKCLLIGNSKNATCTQVVGVAEDIRSNDLTEVTSFQCYIPLAQSDSILNSGPSSLLVRTAGPTDRYEAQVRHAIQATDPTLPYPAVDPMPKFYSGQTRPWRLGSTLFSLFGGLGLLLSAIGLYGVLSYMVSQRTSELGIRVALGAARRDLLTMIVSQGLKVTAIGLAIGLVGSLIAGRALSSLLYGVSPHDPVVLSLVAVVLVLVATLASYFPALRATRVDPMVALRYE